MKGKIKIDSKIILIVVVAVVVILAALVGGPMIKGFLSGGEEDSGSPERPTASAFSEEYFVGKMSTDGTKVDVVNLVDASLIGNGLNLPGIMEKNAIHTNGDTLYVFRGETSDIASYKVKDGSIVEQSVLPLGIDASTSRVIFSENIAVVRNPMVQDGLFVNLDTNEILPVIIPVEASMIASNKEGVVYAVGSQVFFTNARYGGYYSNNLRSPIVGLACRDSNIIAAVMDPEVYEKGAIVYDLSITGSDLYALNVVKTKAMNITEIVASEDSVYLIETGPDTKVIKMDRLTMGANGEFSLSEFSPDKSFAIKKNLFMSTSNGIYEISNGEAVSIYEGSEDAKSYVLLRR